MRRALALMMVAVVASCTSARQAEVVILTYGEACDDASLCEPPLVCGATSRVCEPSGAVPAGGECRVSLDCAAGLFCDGGACAAAGTTTAGLCLGTRDCEAGLRCTFGGLGGVCATAGLAWYGQSCAASADCLAGLVCEPSTGTCATSFADPAGRPCSVPAHCLLDGADLGFYCDAGTSTCRGRGPDGEPVREWSLGCAPGTQLDGTFRVRFEIGAADFFALPYPNQARVAGGALDLASFPRPPAGQVPSPVVERVLAAASASDGFGPSETVFLRFSGPPRFCTSCDVGDNACLQRCMGAGEAARSVYVADVHDGTGVPALPFGSVAYSWSATTGSAQYVCGPYLRVSPTAVSPWRPGHTYFVFVHRRVQGRRIENGVTTYVDQEQAPDFALMLSGLRPASPAAALAWDAYAPLRAWLLASPRYPPGDVSAGAVVLAADVGGGVLFRVRDPRQPLVALAAGVAAASAPLVHDAARCDAASPAPCSDPTAEPFSEVQARIDIPRWQAGTPPFEGAGGGLVFSGGAPVAQGMLAVRVAATVPHGPPPAGGWPVVLYAHGVRGDWRTHVTRGLALTLAQLDVGGTSVGFAVVGYDAVAHGERGAGSSWDAGRLFFNLENPVAARGNALQAAADVLALRRAMADLSAAVAGLVPSGATFDLNRVYLVGDGPGASAAVAAAAVSADLPVVAFAGAGGVILDGLLDRRTPWAGGRYLPLALGDPQLTNARESPVLSILQGYLDDVDPATFAPEVIVSTLGPTAAKHALQIVGVGDTWAPVATQLTTARRLNAGFLDDDASGVLNPSSDARVTAPVTGNLNLGGGRTQTCVASVHVPVAGTDGSAILFKPAVLTRLGQYLGSATLGPIPTVR